jgi:uncharacterized protein
MPIFRHRAELDHSVEDVFAWHTRPGAFERLAPPWEEVRVRERHGGIQPGGRVVLEVRKGPTSFTWTLEHTAFDQNRRFVDEQVSGPFSAWRHEHRFESLGSDRCAVEDLVDWEPPLGSLGGAFGSRFVESNLGRFFAFRSRRLADDLDRHRTYGGDPLTVAITGATGFIGSHLTSFLTAGGHRVLPVTRSEDEGADAVRWDPDRGRIDAEKLEGVDAVVHLAGESLVGLRWTQSKKRAILKSREVGTLVLARALARLRRPPAVLVSGSGVGYYGSRGDEILTEASGPGGGFLADVCRRWESATTPARSAGIRVVHLRTGPVLSPRGGVLGTALPAFRAGLGGRLGSGRQYFAWIDLDDHIGLVLHAIRRPSVRSALNATAPNPVPNSAFTDVLGRVLGRPTILPVPSLAIRSVLGEMGRETLLVSQRAVPEQARETGFRFLRPDLEDSLRFQLGRVEGEESDGGGDAA